jgi:hypothetical protein
MLRDNLVGLIEPMLSSAGAYPLALGTERKQSLDDRSLCLENPRPEGAESTLTENVASPFHAEPRQAHVPSISVPHAEAWLQQAIQELGDELPSIDHVPQDQLTADSQRYVLLVGTASLLWSAIQSATNTWGNQPVQLQPIIQALDNVPLPTSAQDLTRYRTELLAAMPVALAVGPAGAASVQVKEVSAQWSPDQVQRRIERMALLYRSVVWAAVLFTAYQAYYAHNLAFGTLSDYLVLFLWAIGLTQTGTQLLARIHR